MPAEILSLQTLLGPTTQVFTISDGPATIGRIATCEVSLLDDAVSRRHATLLQRDDGWYIVDETSRAGTFLNGSRIEPTRPMPLTTGDLLRIGPWVFRIAIGAVPMRAASTIDDTSTSGLRIHRAVTAPGRSEQRLRLLSECILDLNRAATEAEAARAAVLSAVRGSGYARAAVLRKVPGDEAVELVIAMDAATEAEIDAAGLTFSRSLIEAADAGEAVLLTDTVAAGDHNAPAHGQSLAELEIHSALCAPVALDGSVTGYLYFDARGRESHVRTDAAAFCESLATAYALAVANIKRAALEERDAAMRAQLAAAREVQQMVSPPERARTGPIEYAFRTLPGSFVAGDLFDIVEMPGGGVAVCIGDVAGHGVSAGMLMASVQAFLDAQLRTLAPGACPSGAVSELNRFLCERPLAGRFVSLWVGVFWPDGTLIYIDAGHGHWLHLSTSGDVISHDGIEAHGGVPVGVMPDAVYTSGTLRLGRGERILLYSDGITEQRGAGREEFGAGRLRESLVGATGPAADIDAAFNALRGFMTSAVLDDDATAASIGLA